MFTKEVIILDSMTFTYQSSWFQDFQNHEDCHLIPLPKQGRSEQKREQQNEIRPLLQLVEHYLKIKQYQDMTLVPAVILMNRSIQKAAI